MTCYYFSPVQLLETLWTVAQQASLSMGFSRQGYWNGLPCPLPGDLPDPGIGPVPSASPALQADFSTPEPHWKPFWWLFTGFIFSNVSILTFQCLYFVDISPVNSIVLMVIFFFSFQTNDFFFSLQFSSVQLLSRVRIFVTPWITARQASLSITNSQNLLTLMPIESVIPSNHFILCRPLLLLPPIPPSIRVFSNESTLCLRWLEFLLATFGCFYPSKIYILNF